MFPERRDFIFGQTPIVSNERKPGIFRPWRGIDNIRNRPRTETNDKRRAAGDLGPERGEVCVQCEELLRIGLGEGSLVGEILFFAFRRQQRHTVRAYSAMIWESRDRGVRLASGSLTRVVVMVGGFGDNALALARELIWIRGWRWGVSGGFSNICTKLLTRLRIGGR